MGDAERIITPYLFLNFNWSILWASALFLTLTILILYVRKWHFLWRQEKQKLWKKHIVEELEKLIINPHQLSIFFQEVQGFSRAHRKFFMQLLVSHMNIILGNEREILEKTYIQAGFLDQDLLNIKSNKWWKKIDAYYHLEVLFKNNPNELKVIPSYIFFQDLKHPQVLVSLYSIKLKALSTLNPDTLDIISERLKDKACLSFRPMVLEILINILNNNSLLLISYFKSHFQSPLTPIFIQAIAASKNELAEEFLIEILQMKTFKPEMESEKLYSYTFHALTQTLSLKAIPHIYEHLNSPSISVQAAALKALLYFGESPDQALIAQLKYSSELEIQRVFRTHEKTGAGLKL